MRGGRLIAALLVTAVLAAYALAFLMRHQKRTQKTHPVMPMNQPATHH
jgi:hypothetical protein